MRIAKAATAATLALLAGLATGALIEPKPAAAIPPCATEDAPGPCRWDAPQNGDGQGRSFTVHPDGSVTYDDELIPA